MPANSAIVATASAQALAKSVIDTFITPKFQFLEKYLRTSTKKHLHDYWKNQFTKYLVSKYKSYSVMNTIAFNNQQRLLKDLYIPLSIVKSEDKQTFVIDEFKGELVPYFRKIIITDTAGMGKSTITKRLFLSIVDQNIGVPVIIELRRLNKDKKIINEIIEQLSSIKKGIDEDFVLDLIDRGDFIFFFDGFDEINPDEKSAVTRDIQEFIRKADNNLFVITSRPENSLVSFGDFMSFHIQPLEIEEAYELLRKYNNYGSLSKLLIEKIGEVLPSVKEFLTNPLLVSLLYTAFEYKQTVPFKKHVFYRQVFDALFEAHDLSKGDSYERSKIRKCNKLDREDFHRILRFVGYECLKISKTEFTKDEIIQLLTKAKKFCSDLLFKEADFLVDITTSAPIFSQDGIYYKWTHKSLQEYFAAQFIHLDSKDLQTNILTKIANSKVLQAYINILDLYLSIDPKGFRNVVTKNLVVDFINYCDKNLDVFPISSEIVLKRLELTFVYGYAIVCSSGLIDDSGEIINGQIKKIFNMAREVMPSDIYINCQFSPSMFTLDAANNHVFAVKSPYNYSELVALIYQRDKPSFIKQIEAKKITKNFVRDLEFSKSYLVDNNVNSVLNSVDNFDIITEIIKDSTNNILVLDYAKSKKYLAEIEKERQVSNDLMLEDF